MLLTHFRTWILGCLTKALLDDLSSKKNSSFETASWVWILKGGPLNWLGFARIVDHLAQQHFKTGQSNLRVKFIEHLAPWQKLVGVTREREWDLSNETQLVVQCFFRGGFNPLAMWGFLINHQGSLLKNQYDSWSPWGRIFFGSGWTRRPYNLGKPWFTVGFPWYSFRWYEGNPSPIGLKAISGFPATLGRTQMIFMYL